MGLSGKQCPRLTKELNEMFSEVAALEDSLINAEA